MKPLNCEEVRLIYSLDARCCMRCHQDLLMSGEGLIELELENGSIARFCCRIAAALDEQMLRSAA